MRTPQRRAHVALWILVAPLCVAAIVIGRATVPAQPKPVHIPSVAPDPTGDRSPPAAPPSTLPDRPHNPPTAP